MNDRTLGQQPISANSPVGSNPRDGDTFGALQAEIDKLTDINASAGPDWSRVGSLAEQVLSREGKDLAVGNWLACAWLHSGGPQGLADGIHVLRELHDHYWADMSPPAARLRGRRNQMEWLLQQLERQLAAPRTQWTPLSEAQQTELLADWDALDAVWQEADAEAPAFFKLRRLLSELPVDLPQAEPTPEPAHQPAPAPVAAPTPAAPPPAAVPTPAPVPAPPPPVKTAPLVVPQPALPDLPANLESQTAIESAIERILDALQPVLGAGVEHQTTMPLLYTLGRVRAWATINQAPVVAHGDVTRVPPPSAADIDAFARIVKANDPVSILRYAESRLPSHRFWLDLNRASHAALKQLPGGEAAATAVVTETARLLGRLPALAGMKFSDEHPFADDATRAWLATLSAGVAPAGAGVAAPATGTATAGALSGSLPSETLALATAIAAASAQTEAASALLASALGRLQLTARQIAGSVTP